MAGNDTSRTSLSDKVEGIIHDVFKYAPLPAVSYAVETRWTFGLVKYNAFRIPSRVLPDSLVKNSTVTVLATYSLNKQYNFSVAFDLMHGANRWNSVFRFGVRGFPSLFYGVGNDTRLEDGVLTDFRNIAFSPGLYYDLGAGNFVGGKYLFSHYSRVEAIDSVPDEGYFRANEGLISGVELRYLYDSRDHRVSTHRGFFLEATWALVAPFLGSDFDYQTFALDLRGFLTPWSRVTLATQWYATFQSGEVPIQALAYVGSNDRLRGYYSRRFRDKSAVGGQAEVRFPLFWIVSGAAFAGMGQVAPRVSAIQWSGFHYAGGGGLRVLFDRASRSVLRFDVSFSEEGHTYFLGFGEAF